MILYTIPVIVNTGFIIKQFTWKHIKVMIIMNAKRLYQWQCDISWGYDYVENIRNIWNEKTWTISFACEQQKSVVFCMLNTHIECKMYVKFTCQAYVGVYVGGSETWFITVNNKRFCMFLKWKNFIGFKLSVCRLKLTKLCLRKNFSFNCKSAFVWKLVTIHQMFFFPSCVAYFLNIWSNWELFLYFEKTKPIIIFRK